MTIEFKKGLAHVLGFRHGSRAQVPPPGNAWDYFMMLGEKVPEDARRIVRTYFPELVPAALRVSQIPRSAQTLFMLWPELVPQIRLDRRLGIEFEDVPQWAPCDAVSDAYNMTPQQMHELQPDLVDQCGQNFMAVADDLAKVVGAGKVGAMVSHMPIADCGARFARKRLGITEDDGWLPGKGFGSGAFVHLAYDSGQLVSCDYYPVPAE